VTVHTPHVRLIGKETGQRLGAVADRSGETKRLSNQVGVAEAINASVDTAEER